MTGKELENVGRRASRGEGASHTCPESCRDYSQHEGLKQKPAQSQQTEGRLGKVGGIGGCQGRIMKGPWTMIRIWEVVLVMRKHLDFFDKVSCSFSSEDLRERPFPEAKKSEIKTSWRLLGTKSCQTTQSRQSPLFFFFFFPPRGQFIPQGISPSPENIFQLSWKTR